MLITPGKYELFWDCYNNKNVYRCLYCNDVALAFYMRYAVHYFVVVRYRFTGYLGNTKSYSPITFLLRKTYLFFLIFFQPSLWHISFRIPLANFATVKLISVISGTS